MADFLFELGVEEVPASEINPIKEQLLNSFTNTLKENLISFSRIDSYATNRRFTFIFTNIAVKAEDIEKTVQGPSKKIAYKEDGTPNIPLIRFLESNSASTDDLYEEETKKGPYLFLKKKIEGRDTAEVLAESIPAILGKLYFNKTMVWNNSRVPFVRPVSNILALLDSTLIDCRFAGIESSKAISGHRLLSSENPVVDSITSYIELLQKNFVIIDEKERESKIMDEIRQIESDLNVKAGIDAKMINYFVFNNEYPVVFTGTFADSYLQLPEEIISTFMIDEKKLVPLFNEDGKMINTFIGIANIPDEAQHVKTGNEKVIQAAFEDAGFFWDDDRKDDFYSLREGLHNVMFQKNLGTYFDKTARLSELVQFTAESTGHFELKESLSKAALICKNDLITRMVREFPSLQGVMGGLYLKDLGESEDLWRTVYGHYEPKGFTSQELDHTGAALLSIADKLDNITAFISRGIKISGSKDPYGIRRDANSIMKLVFDFNLDFDLSLLIAKAASYFGEGDAVAELAGKIEDLFANRFESVLKDNLNFRYDIVKAACNSSADTFIHTKMRAEALTEIAKADSASYLASLHKRFRNIAKGKDAFEIKPENLKVAEEKMLFELFNDADKKVKTAVSENRYLEAVTEILEMKPAIDNFFDNVHVMDPDPALSSNRIAILQAFDRMLTRIADFTELIEQ